MDVQKLFDDLESNNAHESEDAKKTLAEFINQTKEQNILQGVMEYYVRTNSVRVIDVLVKVQHPNDIFVLDRIFDWMRGQHRVMSLNLLGFIVRKHPTWLYKIAKHKLIREILKLLLNEKDIIPLMSALLCIITLLPIIPSLVPSFLNDLLEVFGHLAALSVQGSNNLSEREVIHLQIGLYLLFYHLYGMYPNNLLRYLRKFAGRDGAIFESTIRPLLKTVRMHPMLVSSSYEDEMNTSRWKEKEPHDIVVECAKLSLDCNPDDLRFVRSDTLAHGNALEHPETQVRHLQIGNMYRNTTSLSVMSGYSSASPFHSIVDRENLTELQKFSGTIWSPSIEILSTPPPTGTVTHTPTPNYNMPSLPSSANVLGATGASPPEAAVEATPETTPMKDMSDKRPIAANSPAVRALLATSQPTSPMRKEKSPFHFDQQSTHSVKKLMQIIIDREQSMASLDSPTNFTESTTQEDQEVELTNFAANHSDTLQDISGDCGDDTEEQSTYSVGLSGPLSSRNLPLRERRARRNRFKSYCANDNSSYLSYGTSPTDGTTVKQCELIVKTAKIQRSSSWPAIERSTNGNEDQAGNVETDVSRQVQDNVHQNGESSSPSGDDAMSAATHFKRIDQKSTVRKFVWQTATRYETRIVTQYKNAASQTVNQWPYEENLLELFAEHSKLRHEFQEKPMDPYEIFDQHINRNISGGHCREDMLKDQIQLLHLQLHYERYRREIHAERNRRLLGKSRKIRSREKEDDRLRDQQKKLYEEVDSLTMQVDKYRKAYAKREGELLAELETWKERYRTEVGERRNLLSHVESLQRRLNDETNGRKEIHLQTEALRGELFDMRNEMQQLQYQAELGLQYKQELAKLQSEFMLVGEIQVKSRDKMIDIESLKAAGEELAQLQDSYNKEIRELRVALETKSAQFETLTHHFATLHTTNVSKDNTFTDQKRLFKAAKEEYEEKLKALEGKYEIQKKITLQMEERIAELYKSQNAATSLATTTPESEKTDFVSSVDHNSPLSISLASSEGLSTSLRSVTEFRNLQKLVGNQPNPIDQNVGSIPVTLPSTTPQSMSSPQHALAMPSSSSITVRRSSSSQSNYPAIPIGPSTSGSVFNDSARLQNVSSTSSSSSSAL